jgi:hypothetical protein
MRPVQLLSAIVVSLAVACSQNGGPSSAPSGDPTAAPTGASETATAPVSEAATTPASETPTPASEAPTDPPSEEPVAGEDLFSPLPGRYRYVPAPKQVRTQLTAQMTSGKPGKIVDDVAVRYVEKGSVPVAAVLVVLFNDKAGAADLAGFVRGMKKSMGVEAKIRTLGGKDVTYLPGDPKTFVYMGDNFALTFFAVEASEVEKVVAALVRPLD